MSSKVLPTQKEISNFDKIITILSQPNTEVASIREATFKESGSFKSLTINLKLCLTLQVIDIYNCKFEAKTFKLFISSIVMCPTIGWIFLKHNNLKDNHIEYIIERFHEFESLVCLNLSDNLISKKCAQKLSSHIFRCPTLVKLFINDNYKEINEEIASNLKDNSDRIASFHSMVLKFQSDEYEFKLSFYPTLINSFNNGKTLLHSLAADEKYNKLLINVLKVFPNPYRTDICYDKTPLDIAVDENKEILQQYVDMYRMQYYQKLLK